MEMESHTADLPETGQEAVPDEGWTFQDIILALVAFAVVAAAAIGGFLYYESTVPPAVNAGDPAPNFTKDYMNGGTGSLADYRGKVVLVNIWATWCNPCREEMPYLQKLSENLKDQPFVLLAVSQDDAGPQVVRDFANDLQYTTADAVGNPVTKHVKLTFPIMLDPQKELSSIYHTTGYPESLIIDKDGIVRDRVIGGVPNNDWLNSPEYYTIMSLIQDAGGSGLQGTGNSGAAAAHSAAGIGGSPTTSATPGG